VEANVFANLKVMLQYAHVGQIVIARILANANQEEFANASNTILKINFILYLFLSYYYYS
jgi:5-keto 4-deoxyuronate isomerase